jgi:DNA-binding SARP family transcriptional activator
MAELSVQLLGEFQLTYQGIPLLAFHQPRVQALLAWLLINRDRPQSRQQLAYTFWPDTTESQARNNLRQALYQIRHALPERAGWLQSDATTVWWQHTDAIELDILCFEHALAQAERAQQHGDTRAMRAALEEALQYYQGELLPNCYDDWVQVPRQRLNALFQKGLEALIGSYEAHREYAAAIPYLQRLLQVDSINEDAYARLMRLYALEGDRPNALRVYQRSVEALQAELGVLPGEPLQQLFQQLNRQQLAGTPLAEHVGVAGVPSLVGRESEWMRLRASWDELPAKQSRLVLIAGEAGVGKTRLADELCTWIRYQGAATASTRAYAAEARLAYAPLAAWLRSAAIAPHLATLEPIWRTELARLLPELLTADPTLASPGALRETWQRQRFYQALVHGVLAGEVPVALQFDDLQWCDQETLEWLHVLLRSVPPQKLLVVGTLRIGEASSPALQVLFQSLQRSNQLIELAIRPLDAAETAHLAAQLLGHALSLDQIMRLFGETEGNPLFIGEMVHQIEQAGAGEVQRTAENRNDTPMPLPPKVYAVIAGRLGLLSQPARELLAVAATIGRAFHIDILAHASGQQPTILGQTLEELWQHRIIREQGTQHYDFSHDKLRDVVYRELSPFQRRALHMRVAQAIEFRYADDRDPFSAELAAHYEQAGAIDQALFYYEQAALVAQQVFAHENAITLVQRGLALVASLPQKASRDQHELVLQTTLGASWVALKGYGATEAFEAYSRARSLYQQRKLPPSAPILRALVLAYLGKSQFDEALAIGEQILGYGMQHDDQVLIVEGHYAIGVARFYPGMFGQSRWHFEQALAQYDAAQAQQHITLYAQDPKVVCLNRLALDLCCLGDRVAAYQYQAEALHYAQQLEHPFSLGYCLGWGALLFSVALDHQSTRSYSDAAIALGHEHRLGQWLPMGQVLHGWARGWQSSNPNERKQAMNELQAGIDAFYATGFASLRPYFLALLADMHLQQGDFGECQRLVQRAIALIEQGNERWCLAELYRRLGDVLYQTGVAAQANEAYQQALAIADTQGAQAFAERALAGLARLHE